MTYAIPHTWIHSIKPSKLLHDVEQIMTDKIDTVSHVCRYL